MKKAFFKNSNTQIISLAVLSLVAVGLFAFSSEMFKKGSHEELNPFVQVMPVNYVNAFEAAPDNDDKIFHTIVEGQTSKDLLIFRRFPKPHDVLRDFIVSVVPKNTEESSAVKLDLTNSGVLYNYNNKTYAVFRKSLPLIEIAEVNFVMKDNKNKLTGISGNETKFANPYLPLFEGVLRRINIPFLPSRLEESNDSLFERTQNLEDYIVSKNATIGMVETPTEFWRLLENKDEKSLSMIRIQGSEKKIITEKLSQLLSEDLALAEIVDISKLARFEALRTIFTSGCNEPLYLRFNKKSRRLEPIFVNSNCLGERASNGYAPKLKNVTYLTEFARITDSLAPISIKKGWIDADATFAEKLKRINKFYPLNIFDAEVLGINRRILNRVVHAATILKSELVSISPNELVLTTQNVSAFPVAVNALNYQTNKRIVSLNKPVIIAPNTRDTVRIILPRSFENLFVHKKSKTTGFVLEKDIYDLRLVYSIEGTAEVKMIGISPYQPLSNIQDDLFRSDIELGSFSDISEDNKRKEITFQSDSIVISSPLIIPNGYTFKISPGTTLNIVEGGKIISNGPLQWVGTKEQPINVISTDKKGQGMLVLSEGKPSKLTHVFFRNLTNPKHGNWSVTGAVTFYESPVILDYVTVENNRCEDALNIVRSKFTMDHSRIAHTQSDAFDGDFVVGTIKNSEFYKLGNDGIDVSGSKLTINNVTIVEAGDKGLSAGEDSEMILSNIEINESEIGIAGKDLSTVTGDNIKINNNKLAFTAFKKKPEFGPSNIKLTNVLLSGIETEHLIENKSVLMINGVQMETLKNVKSKMYGVEFGKSSKDTRTSQ